MARLSKVGDRSSGTLACPKCGGTSFKAKRGASKFLFGLLAPKRKAKCQTCGASYKRG